MSTPNLSSVSGLSINTGEVQENTPVLSLIQKVNDAGDAQFNILELRVENTTEDEQIFFLRGYLNGQEQFSIRPGGAFIGGSVFVISSITAGASTLDTTTLNLAGNVFLTTDGYNVLSLRRGNQPQTLRVYGAHQDEGPFEYLDLSFSGGVAKISTQKQNAGVERELALGVGSSNSIRLSSSNQVGFFGAAPVSQPVLGSASASASYGAPEQAMLNKAYQALRTLGLAS
jgi:hypothetical protein